MSQSSKKFSIAIFVIALLFLSYSVYIFYKTDSLQNEKVEDLTSEADEAGRRISDLRSNLDNLYVKLDNLLKIKEDLENLSTDLGEIKELVTENGDEIDALTTDFEIVNESLTELSATLTQVDEITAGVTQGVTAIVRSTPASVYESVRKSVVHIRTDTGQGSGFVWKTNKYILTNWHVVNETDTVTAEFYDGTRRSATVIGLDAYSDVAVLLISGVPNGTVPLELGNSSGIYVGQQVVAIGNPMGNAGSLSSGLVSQVNEKIDLPPLISPVLQLDVTIAPGSSGGPLLDLQSKVLGITNAGTIFGYNFAIPSNVVKRVAESIVSTGEFKHPLVGFWGTELTPEVVEEYNLVNVDLYQNGILITRVREGFPAAEAGLRPFEKTIDREGFTAYIARDIIIAVDGITLKNWSDWHVYFAEKVSPDQTIIMTLLRDGLLEKIELTTTYRDPYE
ncbi:MAG: trypsin-like peptidase domain-containing protein [Candidatus Bathyarchaeota archaeon]|nr:trypsin-like peptidase domain-containing protein [Candidatus Bathyarchaeota archaeon]